MKKTIVLGFIALGVTFAASNTYKVEIFQKSMVEGKTLKPGEYKVTFANGNATLKNGKDSIQVPARQENETNKVSETALTYDNNSNLQEIAVGGTHTKILFDGAAAPMQPGL
jgi:hypothetical protein